MTKLVAFGAAAGIAALSLVAAPAAQAAPADGRCVKAGLSTLRSLDALPLAAQGKLDYSPYSTYPGGAGLIRTPLPPGSFLPLSTVIHLHQTHPELFAWCSAS